MEIRLTETLSPVRMAIMLMSQTSTMGVYSVVLTKASDPSVITTRGFAEATNSDRNFGYLVFQMGCSYTLFEIGPNCSPVTLQKLSFIRSQHDLAQVLELVYETYPCVARFTVSNCATKIGRVMRNFILNNSHRLQPHFGLRSIP